MRVAALALLACLLVPSGRAAADEKEFVLALAPGFAFAKVGDRTAWGGGGGLDVNYGITDALSLRLTGAVTGHSLPAGDKEGWARMHKVGSFFFPHLATCGAGISKENPIELGNYPYPIFVTYAAQPADQVYAMTKAMIVNYDAYKDSAPGASGLAADRQTKNWVVPVHPGAVKALKEAGQWSDAQETHNNALYKRQEVLASAWADYNKGNPPSEEKAFVDGWLKTRADALAKANMPNGFGE